MSALAHLRRVSGVYEIVNLLNGKRYIGSAVCLARRFTLHRSELSFRRHHSRHLQSAWNKYGEAAFSFQPLLICAKRDLIDYEQRCMDGFRPEYNLAPLAGSNLGNKQSAETIEKKRASLKGRKPSTATITAAIAANKARIYTPEMRARMASCRKGVLIPHTPETRAKLSAAHTGKKHSAEHIENHARKVRGQKRSPEYCARQSAIITAWWASRRSAAP